MYQGKNYKNEIDIIYGCERCNLYVARNNIAVYRGNPRSDIMVIGEAPGYREDQQGKPMVGPTGSFLVSLFKHNGLTLFEYFITNVLLCRPPFNDDPTIEQMNACSHWLNWQIKMINPKWIIAVGRFAYSRLNPNFILNRDKITKVEGEIISPLHLKPINVTVIQHPSAIKQAKYKTEVYEALVSRLVKTIKSDLAA